MASVDIARSIITKHARRRRWAGALLGPASLVGLGLTLWGTVLTQGWAADDAMMAGVDRGPAVAVARIDADLEVRK